MQQLFSEDVSKTKAARLLAIFVANDNHDNRVKVGQEVIAMHIYADMQP